MLVSETVREGDGQSVGGALPQSTGPNAVAYTVGVARGVSGCARVRLSGEISGNTGADSAAAKRVSLRLARGGLAGEVGREVCVGLRLSEQGSVADALPSQARRVRPAGPCTGANASKDDHLPTPRQAGLAAARNGTLVLTWLAGVCR